MSSPEESLRTIVGEMVDARRTRQQQHLAGSAGDPLPVARADLLYLWDEYRTEYLDFAMQLSPLGHRPQPVHGAVADHLRYYGYTAPPGQHVLRWPVDYAEALSAAFSGPVEDSPPARVLFCEGQRDAVNQAVLLAGSRSGAPRTAVLDTGWHDQVPDRELLSAEDSPARLDSTVHGALLFAPVDTAAVPVPHLRDWVFAARERDIPVIIDESVTGFGRTGALWAQQLIGVVADLTVLGGPVGGGLPLGAVVGAERFFDPDFLDLSPHAGHPWACAAGKTVLDGVHPGVLEHVADSAAALTAALDSLVAQFPHRLTGYHGVGLLRGLVFADRADARRFPRAARDHGLHVAPAVGRTVLLAPALVSSTHEVTRGVDLFASVLLSWEDA